MTTEIERHDPVSGREQRRDERIPGPAALGDAVDEDDGATIAGREVVDRDVGRRVGVTSVSGHTDDRIQLNGLCGTGRDPSRG